MRYTLSHWQCFEIDSREEWGRVRVFAGVLPRGLFQVTGDIVEFDALTRVVGTSLGNTYELEGEPGLKPSAFEEWQGLCEKKRLTGVIEVTEEIRSSME